jgi:SNF2 family DNA or RNA helicase
LSKNKKYTIVYNLSQDKGLEVWLPNAFICNVDELDQPAYIQALALPETISGYIDDYDATSDHSELLDICNELTITALENYFFKNKKKGKNDTLASLFVDNVTKKRIQTYIDRRIDKFLQIICDKQFHLCLNLVRKEHALSHKLIFVGLRAEPNLTFVKTQTGIKYSLTVGIGDQEVILLNHQVILIANIPGIFILDNKMIVWINKIDAAKLKPFIKNESVFIPDRSVKAYFEQFVSEMLNKVEIRAEGFEASLENTLISAELLFVFPFTMDRWCLDIRYKYEHFSFLLSEKIQKRHKINVSDNNRITVLQCERNSEMENKIIQVLLKFGFQLLDGRLLYFGDGKFSTIEYTGLIIDDLKKQFTISELTIDNKKMSLEPLKEEDDFKLVNDWFDLHGNVRIGDDIYPIDKLFDNIKHDNPYFKLNDGTFVIIPEELMAKYSQLVRFGVVRDGHWRLNKAHFMLIDAENHAPTSTNVLVEEVAYFSSPLLKATLRPYQIEGVKWLIKHRLNGLGACLADDMGLGKTLQTIAALLDAKENKKSEDIKSSVPVQLDLFGEVITVGRKALNALIVLPASLVFNWHSEIKKYAPSLQVVNYTGANRKLVKSTLMSFDVILTTYQTLIIDLDFFQKQHFHYVILDESQQIRNKQSKTFQTVNALNCDNRISLSGTPIENSLSDLWAQMEFINPDILGSFAFFKANYMIPIEKDMDAAKITELKSLIAPYILRRTKGEVAKDLPELIENIAYAEMSDSQATIYEKEKSATRNYLAGLDKNDHSYRFNVLASIMKLRQIANHPLIAYEEYTGESGKFDEITNQITTITKAKYKILIFSSFISHLELIEKWLLDAKIAFAKLTGGSNQREREQAVAQFQDNPDIAVFLISIKAGGTGLNLTAADYVFILDPWWNPFIEKQALARAHRIGRINNVMVTRFITRNTIEERIMQLQAKKKNLSDEIIEVDALPNLSDSELEYLLD